MQAARMRGDGEVVIHTIQFELPYLQLNVCAPLKRTRPDSREQAWYVCEGQPLLAASPTRLIAHEP